MKTLAFFLAIFFPCVIFSASCPDDCEDETDWTLEVRLAYYQPTYKQLTKVYSNQLIDYQVAVSKRVHNYFEIWGELDWTIKSSNVHRDDNFEFYGFKNRSRLSILPLSLGVKFIYPLFRCVDVYLGAGGTYSILRVRNKIDIDSSFYERGYYASAPFKKEIYKYAFGGLFKAGIQIAMSSSTFLDIFADYISQRFSFSSHDDESGRSLFKRHLDCSGFKFGVGLGVYF